MKTRTLLVGLLAGGSLLGVVAPAASASPASSEVPQVPLAAAAPIPGVHYIRPAHTPGKCVTVHGWDASDGAKIDQWTCQGQSNQRWSFISSSFRYWVKSDFSNKCLDGGDLKKGRKVTQRACHSAFKQLWNPVLRGRNTYEIHVGALCLDVEGGSRSNGARLVLWKCKNVANQRFYLN